MDEYSKYIIFFISKIIINLSVFKRKDICCVDYFAHEIEKFWKKGNKHWKIIIYL
jgi:hypothetical protein